GAQRLAPVAACCLNLHYLVLDNHISMLLKPLFFFNDTATTEIYTLSLHDALPISSDREFGCSDAAGRSHESCQSHTAGRRQGWRSEEHTSELQSRFDLVCRLLLEKKKTISFDQSVHHSKYDFSI